MTISITEAVTKEAIAMLIDLAERGEINPWDVQVIDVVDRFLSRLISDDRRDLYESGHALLYASMLVLLKANTLSQVELALESESDLEHIESFDQLGLPGLPTNLEQIIRRRPVALPPAGRKITLAELIAQLEAIAETIDQKQGKRTSVIRQARQTKQSRQSAMQAIAHLAHKENLSEVVVQLEQYFGQNSMPMGISQLAAIFNDRVGVFWGLLFLSAQSKVELQQADFYGEIQVIPLIQNQEAS
jgi:segregation and condensation protein A